MDREKMWTLLLEILLIIVSKPEIYSQDIANKLQKLITEFGKK